ncbi:MAG: hypothetical protein DRN65_04140, partial [Thaumarchaeota archaeon]
IPVFSRALSQSELPGLFLIFSRELKNVLELFYAAPLKLIPNFITPRYIGSVLDGEELNLRRKLVWVSH